MLVMTNGRGLESQTLTGPEMNWLAGGEHMCKTMNVTIICTRCKSTLQGQNAETDTVVTVTCKCRERHYRQGV